MRKCGSAQINNKEIHDSRAACRDNVYTLFSVVNHQGKMDTGHYTMYAKHRNEVTIDLHMKIYGTMPTLFS